ncbi:APC family permease [Streptomyces sp. S.PB5]|uniref:APC family permease n=1 Tax=Streptomyces sp. S.PB5 TaxID=3020844 RepID=UPI0025B26876|nr:APC family permease [Streptomyces sp. S.PB5]MDN3027512.1 APC family permease [Streptomyces sp. S.PB5]
MADLTAQPDTGTTKATPAPGLRGSIGVTGIVFLVVAAAAPLTAIGGALPVMFAIGNGPGVPAAYLLVAAVLLLFSVGYAAMSRHVVDAGAFYSYVTAGLGRVTGTGAAGLALLTYSAIQAGIYGLAGVTAGGLVTEYGGPDLPWWTWSGLLLALVAVLGYRNIEVGTKVLSLLIVLEVGIVAVVAVAVLVQGGADGIDLDSFTPHSFSSGSPGIGVMFAVASFVGFEATAIYGEEARDPKRSVAKATYFAVVLIGVFYALASWAMVLAVGTGKVQSAAAEDTSGLVFAVAGQYVGSAASDLMEILLLTSLFAALLAFHSAIARYLFSLGRQGSVPAALARSHGRHGSPHIGSLAQTVSAAVVVAVFALAGADPVLQLFTWMSGLATLGVLVLMILVSVAVVVFFARGDADSRLWHTRIAPVLGGLGLCAVVWLVLDNFTTLIGGSAALAGLFEGVVVLFFVIGTLIALRRRT